jgi:hypothetical protein
VSGRTYVAPISFGLGDLVVSLPAIQAVIADDTRRGRETWLVARSSVQAALAERIGGLAGCVSEEDGWLDLDATVTGGEARLIDLRDHPIQRDHWWGSPEFEQVFGTIEINDIIGRIAADLGLEVDTGRPRALRAVPRSELRATVVLITATDGAAKRWPDERWRSLVIAIRATGVPVRAMCQRDPTQRGATASVTNDDIDLDVIGVTGIAAPTPGDAIDVLSDCRAVVGVDTGLTHVAVQQGTPTVMITRAGNVFVRRWNHCKVVTGVRCDSSCIAVDIARAHNARVDLRGFRHQPLSCPAASACLDPITPDKVFAALQEVW